MESANALFIIILYGQTYTWRDFGGKQQETADGLLNSFFFLFFNSYSPFWFYLVNHQIIKLVFLLLLCIVLEEFKDCCVNGSSSFRPLRFLIGFYDVSLETNWALFALCFFHISRVELKWWNEMNNTRGWSIKDWKLNVMFFISPSHLDATSIDLKSRAPVMLILAIFIRWRTTQSECRFAFLFVSSRASKVTKNHAAN